MANLYRLQMTSGKKIFFTVTNDLVFDQRMQRICSSMVSFGYDVTLVGREMPGSPALPEMPFKQVRIALRNQKGKLFYLEYNYKLNRYLLSQQMDAICAIDLDTIVPAYLVSKKKGIPRMYDAHEFFTEMIEVKRRGHIHFIWKKIEEWLVPKFSHGYTVGQAIADDLKKLYDVNYALIRNVPYYAPPIDINAGIPEIIREIMEAFNSKCPSPTPFIFYQGALNEGRALLPMLEAMKKVNARMLMAGSGNMENEVMAFIRQNGLQEKVYLCGNVPPHLLKHLTAHCYAGVTLYDAFSKNQYYSLGNKFFDYIMARKPQVCVNYPEYAAILKQFKVAIPIPETSPAAIAFALNNLIQDGVLYHELQHGCNDAALALNWEKEAQQLRQSWEDVW
jgi:glycosyltransferase involved in cell wall biosynthesis